VAPPAGDFYSIIFPTLAAPFTAIRFILEYAAASYPLRVHGFDLVPHLHRIT
jgi:hypothetical protein